MAPRLAPQRAVSGTGAVTGDRADGGGGGGGGALVERVGAVCDAFGRSMEAHNLRCRDLKCCTRTALGRGDDVQTLAISTVIVAGASGVELKRVALKAGKLCSGKFGLLKNLVPVRAVAEALVAGELPCTPPDAQARRAFRRVACAMTRASARAGAPG